MKSVVIVGQAARSIEHPPDAEVWVINGPRVPPGWDRLFQLHGLDHIRQVDTDGKLWDLLTHVDVLGGQRLLMYPGVAKGCPELDAETYPLDMVVRGLPDHRHPYLTGSFALAIALAVVEDFERIMLDGVQFHGTLDHWSAGEAWAIPCIEYHLGRAEGLGVKVEVPPGSGLFRFEEFVYGFTGPGSI